MLEADSFWCMQKLLEGIQDNYTLAQPGIQTKIMALKDLIKRLDGRDSHMTGCVSHDNMCAATVQIAKYFVSATHFPLPWLLCFPGSLDAHLSKNSVEYIQFAFRWMNNLLMREFPLRCVIRLWDSYLVRLWSCD